jgi:hypothetical protein
MVSLFKDVISYFFSKPNSMEQNTRSSKRPRTHFDSSTGLSSDEINAIVQDIREFKGSNDTRETHFKKKYASFAEMYPSLFSMVCEDNFDLEKYTYMMRLREQVRNSERTVEDTSKEVGQKFFDIYVDNKHVKL